MHTVHRPTLQFIHASSKRYLPVHHWLSGEKERGEVRLYEGDLLLLQWTWDWLLERKYLLDRMFCLPAGKVWLLVNVVSSWGKDVSLGGVWDSWSDSQERRIPREEVVIARGEYVAQWVENWLLKERVWLLQEMEGCGSWGERAIPGGDSVAL
jgi:hypothetical protein